MGKFRLKQTGTNWQFDLLAGNNEPILQSESYESKVSADNGIESVRTNSQREGAFEVKESSNGQFYFVLKATNGQVVGQSEMYTTAGACQNGVESVQENAANAEVTEG